MGRARDGTEKSGWWGDLGIKFCNIRGKLSSKVDNISEFMSMNNTSIFGLGETNLGVDEEMVVPGYKWVNGRGTKQQVGGIGIWAKEDLIVRKEQVRGEGWAGIRFKQGTKWRGVIFCYCWQNGKEAIHAERDNTRIRDEMGELIRKWKQEGVSGWIIMGDFNARMGWLVGDRLGSRNKPGKIVEGWAKDMDLIIMNGLEGVEGVWTWMMGKRKSVVDYIMIGGMDKSEISAVKIWDDGDERIDSDHSPLSICVLGKAVERSVNQNVRIKWEKIRREEWQEINEKTQKWWNERRDLRDEAGIGSWEFFKGGLREGVRELKRKMEGKVRRIMKKGSMAVRNARKEVGVRKKAWIKALKKREIVGMIRLRNCMINYMNQGWN